MKTRKPKKNATKSSLSRLLGVSRQLISAHCKDPDAPPIDNPEKWALFLAAKGRSGSVPPELRRKIAEARLAILRATRARMELENRKAEGRTMLVEDGQRQAAEACSFFFAELGRMERELPPALAGGTAVDIFKRLHSFTETLRGEAKARFERIGAE
jgi:hypothetical protein